MSYTYHNKILSNYRYFIQCDCSANWQKRIFQPLLSTVERNSGNYVILEVINPNIHLTRCLWLKKAMIVPKGRHLNIVTSTKKVENKRYVSVFESAHKVLNFYGIEVCPNISAFENKNLKMKMWNIGVPCHAYFSYLLAGTNVLTYFNF